MLLCTMSFPLAVAFLVYHVYLVWAGMTTNESAKWSDWKEDIADQLVWRAEIERLRETYPKLPDEVEPDEREGRWPREIVARWWMVRTRDGSRPTQKKVGSQPLDDTEASEEPDERWVRVDSMREVENLYDRGIWDNLVDDLFNRGAW